VGDRIGARAASHARVGEVDGNLQRQLADEGRGSEGLVVFFAKNGSSMNRFWSEDQSLTIQGRTMQKKTN